MEGLSQQILRIWDKFGHCGRLKSHEHPLVQIQNSYCIFSHPGMAGVISFAFIIPQGTRSVPPELEIHFQYQVAYF
jgi:hypothetical protein